MKFFLAFLAIFAAASAQEDCELCKLGVDALGNYLLTEAELAAVEEGRIILKKNHKIRKYLYIV
jgi:hypothetical protein